MADETPKTPEAPAAPGAKAPKRPPDAKENFRYIIRLANTDLEGARTVVYALTNIKGLGIRMAEGVTALAGIPPPGRIGDLPRPPRGPPGRSGSGTPRPSRSRRSKRCSRTWARRPRSGW